MKKTLVKISVLLAAAQLAVGAVYAQNGIDRRIEVTRQYIPEVGAAEKLDFMPAQVDTVPLRPEINYSITPTPWKGVFDTKPINPIKINAERYHPERPFFLRLAAGLPLQTLADFYATANPRSDMAFGAYVNHYGRWAGIRNDFGDRENAAATHNVAGAFFEKRFARKTLSVDISDTYRYYNAFGGAAMPAIHSGRFAQGAKIGYNDLSGRVTFGDRFIDLSRFNYRAGISAGTFADREKTGQNELEVFFDSGWRLYGGDFTAGIEFCLESGTGRLSGHRDWRLAVTPGYAFGVKNLDVGVGLDFVYNRKTSFHIFPKIDLAYKKFHGFTPYLRIDGALEDGCYRMLTYANPYVLSGLELPHPSHYDFRVGAHGAITRAVSYDLYFSAAIWSDYNYFVNDSGEVAAGVYDASRFAALSNDNVSIFSAGGALSATIVWGLTFDLGLKVNMVSQSAASTVHWYGEQRAGDEEMGLGIPRFSLDAILKYNYRDRLFLSAGVEVMGRREFSSVWKGSYAGQSVMSVANSTVPAAANLKLEAEYRVNSRLNAFLRGDNLLNRRLYRFNHYPELGANVMLGVKIAF
jgi:hypothetical protein